MPRKNEYPLLSGLGLLPGRRRAVRAELALESTEKALRRFQAARPAGSRDGKRKRLEIVEAFHVSR